MKDMMVTVIWNNGDGNNVDVSVMTVKNVDSIDYVEKDSKPLLRIGKSTGGYLYWDYDSVLEMNVRKG